MPIQRFRRSTWDAFIDSAAQLWGEVRRCVKEGLRPAAQHGRGAPDAEEAGGEPDHEVLQRPWEYEIVWFSYSHDVTNRDNSFIDMTLRKEDEVRRLRFFRPQGLRIQEGFPNRTGGFFIGDLRGRQWEDLGVEVGDCEDCGGGVYFFAKSVVELKDINCG